MITTLVLLLLSAAGSASQRQEALNRATPNATGSQTQREKASLDAYHWAQSRTPLVREYESAILANSGFLKLFSAQGNTSAVRRVAIHIEAQLQAVARRWQGLAPSPLADFNSLNTSMITMAELAADAYADYVAGLTRNYAAAIPMKADKSSITLLGDGDTKLNRSIAILRTLHARLAALDKKYGVH